MLKSLLDRVDKFNFDKLNRDSKVFSCGICKIFQYNYFEEHLRTTASEMCSFTWTALTLPAQIGNYALEPV